jgi:hypothetical protein
VRDSDNGDYIRLDALEKRVREAAQQETPNALREWMAEPRMDCERPKRAPSLGNEVGTETW